MGTSTTSVNVQIATMNKLAGIELLPVPYKGIPASITDVIGGSLDATLADLSNAMAQAKGGKLRPIAVTSLRRNALAPDWPAIAETLPGFDLPSWVAVVGPANMPRDVAEKLNAAIGQALKQPEVIEKLAGIGMTPMPMTTAQFRTYLDAEITKWGRLARDANIQPE